MRRILPVVMLLSLLLVLVQPAVAVDRPELVGSVVTVNAGHTAEVSISIKNNPGISSIRLFMQYDTDVFEPQVKADTMLDVTTSTLTQSGILFSTKMENGIQILWGAEKDVVDDGVLFTARFETDTFATGDYPFVITYSTEDTTNSTGSEIVFSVTDGKVSFEKSAVICVGAASGVVGGTVTVPVSVVQNPGFATAVLSFSYDPEVLALTAIKKGSLLSSETGSFSRNVNAGRVAWFDSANTTGDGVLFELVFSVLSQEEIVETTVTAALTDGAGRNFGNSANQAIPVCFIDGTVTMKAGVLAVRSAELINYGEILLQLDDAPASEVMVIIAAYQNGKMISVSPKKQICNVGENQLTYDHPSGADTVNLFFAPCRKHDAALVGYNHLGRR